LLALALHLAPCRLALHDPVAPALLGIGLTALSADRLHEACADPRAWSILV